jgi:hypothetical protein
VDYLKAIEEFITVPISRASVTKREYNETIEDADDGANDWKKLIEQSSLKPQKKTKRK